MEACTAVEKDVDKVISKLESIKEHSDRVLTDLFTELTDLKKELENAPEDHVLTPLQEDLVKQVSTKVKNTLSRLATEHRDVHSSVSKVGKSIDRNFVQDFATCSRDEIFNSQENMHIINKIICQHYYRQGMHDIADELASDSNVVIGVHEKEPFTELHDISEKLKNKEVEPLLTWTDSHREALETQNSSLEFLIHRLRYIDILKDGATRQLEAIDYARLHFKKFINKHEKDIQNLMGMLVYIHSDMVESPYKHFFVSETDLWLEIYDTFIKDACQLLGVCVNSPLITCINAGCQTIPALLNIKQVMMQRQVSGILKGHEELPIEIDLGSESRYHSMFACPILRQLSTKNNPPMKLVCGHVISRDALQKLCSSNKMKCPYCPVEQSPQDAKLIHF